MKKEQVNFSKSTHSSAESQGNRQKPDGSRLCYKITRSSLLYQFGFAGRQGSLQRDRVDRWKHFHCVGKGGKRPRIDCCGQLFSAASIAANKKPAITRAG